MKVSVVLTSYNHEEFLRESIDSVLQQTYKDFELIIVDDCSTDCSWDIIDSYTDERIIKIRNPINLRTDGTYHVIMNVAAGEYIAIQHSDDVWESEKLEKEVAYLDGHPHVAAVFTYVKTIDENSEEYKDSDGFYYKVFDQPNRSRYEWLNYFFNFGNCLCHPSSLIRKSAFEEDIHNLYDFGLAQIPDLAKWVRICLKHNIYIIPERLTRFRIQNDGKNTSGNRPDAMIRSSIELFHFLKLYLNIPTKEEFLKVFPDAEEYVCGDHFFVNYALARVCTRNEMNSYTRLFGYELLFDLMNEREIAKIIEEEYGYTFRDLIRETGTRDIFHVLPEKSDQTATVYIDVGEDFSENAALKKSYFLLDHYMFEQEFDLEEYEEKRIVHLRFDPAEGILCECSNVRLWVDGKEIELYPLNSLLKDGERDTFIDLDPIYMSKELDCYVKKIKITASIKRISDSQIAGVISSLQKKIEHSKNQFPKIENNLPTVLHKYDKIESRMSFVQRECTLCQNKVEKYRPLHKIYLEEMEKYGYPKTIPETFNGEEYECPICYGLDRDRLCAAFIRNIMKKDMFIPLFMLDIAPSIPFSKFIAREFPNIIYHTADLYMENTSYRMDIQNMFQIEDEVYDVFVCCHVLEHVQSDIKAMKELYRILKQDGLGLLLVPIDLQQKFTDEEWGCSEEENWRRFGQGDHVRKYSKKDFVQRLESIGFFVNQLGKDYFGDLIFQKNALTETSTLYVVSKSSIEPGNLASQFGRSRLFTENPLSSKVFYDFYKRNQSLKIWINECKYHKRMLHLYGWCFIDNVDSNLSSLKVALINRKKVILYSADLVIREDIEKKYNDSSDGKYLKSGIQFDKYLEDIDPGKYKVVIALQNGHILSSYDTEYTVKIYRHI